MKDIMETIANEMAEVIQRTDSAEAKELAEELSHAKRIFIAGAGRSGLVGRVFAMRLMHSGYPVFVVGETITPSIEEKDLLLVISGSGSTGTLLSHATKAKEIQARIALVTTTKESEIGQISNCTVQIPAATKKRLAHEPSTIQPLGSQFDQAAHLLLDAVIIYLLNHVDKEKGQEKLQKKHANLE
ncbi:6-phospho-3-hexuloisomerase [Virgibacillus halodenitrificans]|uniref:6-phospho-3-hexuloisomerase n=1 Tax=Virgibacillus halodenitrificans TaxID=1482 RepID=UPI002DBC3F60|nr:6-phospho-3-hexuloisomerase [Virgibacillus halodenitrificans]MEC2159596.1 6-phospho-3-hexuloisomerase [Virgibacillus halodenitrificans]